VRLPCSGDHLDFACNVCGQRNRLPLRGFHRETALCSGCGANARFRGVVHVLAQHLGIDPALPLAQWPLRPDLRGLGMSDWHGYATLLAERMAYRNTFYDREPRLDIAQPPADELRDSQDFVITTDVFEHILEPLQPAFDHLLALLRPGGALVFSVPYTRQAHTVEHFPGLHHFELVRALGQDLLVNRRRDGTLQVYDGLVFHGGEGATLEMRLFCEADLLQRLAAAGFEDIVVHSEPVPEVGYYWPPLEQADPAAPLLYAYIISARRPPC